MVIIRGGSVSRFAQGSFFAAMWFVCVPLFAPLLALAAPPPASEMNQVVDGLINRMTVEEKVGQLGLVSGNMSQTGPGSTAEYRKKIEAGKVGAVLNVYTPAVTRELQDLVMGHSRLKIPLLFGLDVVWGYHTIFPIPLAESSSWNLPLIEKSARLAAEEASADGIHWTYAPMVDVARDPRWGRVAEGAGEDQWLGAKVAAARVHGFQGDYLSAADSVLACVKHFAAYGAALAGRDYGAVDMSQRELLETYLPPYEAAVKAGVASLMTSFNTIAGVPSASNEWLLTKLLRKTWGFTGFIVSDYAAVSELVNHGVAANDKAATIMAINAGLDMDMESNDYSTYLAAAVKAGKVSKQTLDAAVRHVLEAKYKKGLLTSPVNVPDADPTLAASQRLVRHAHAREIGRRSIVLLKNDGGLLPLKSGSTVAVIGPQVEIEHGNKEEGVTLHMGMSERAARSNIKLLFADGAHLLDKDMYDKTPEGQALVAEAVKVASQADVVVMALGEPEGWSGEAASRTRIRLPRNQQTLLDAVVATGRPVVLVLTNGRPLALENENAQVQAILETWILGSESGHAIADVLFGDYNPSGKLTMSFPYNEGQIPIFYSELNTGRPLDPDDPFSSKYLNAPNEPLFPFGWGLSYTKFTYSDVHLSKTRLPADEALEVDVTVTNSGAVAGEETVQLYIRQMVAPVSRPVKQLRGYAKVFLQPGESRKVTLPLTLEDFKYFDQKLKWTWSPSKFKVMVGGNSAELMDAEFTLEKPTRRM